MTPYYGSNEVKVNFNSIRDVAAKTVSTLDVIWQAAWFFTKKSCSRPNWAGYMQQATSQPDTVFEKATGKFLPIIDLKQANETRIYSTILFVTDEAIIGIPTPCITFDQPLRQKAFAIAKNQNLNAVCILGGFHTLMSLFGSIGILTSDSGLAELFDEVYSGVLGKTHLIREGS